MAFLLNGFEATFSAKSFVVHVSNVPQPDDVADLRERHGREWFMHWREGKLYSIPRVAAPSFKLGISQTADMDTPGHLAVLSARINDCLPEKFPQYDAFRNRPFVFLGKRDELVQKSVHGWNNAHALVSLFKIRPRFELDARTYELRERELRVGLFMSVDTKWDILAPVHELVAAGIDVKGLYVVRRTVQPEQRRLVGKIASVNENTVELSEAYDELKSIPSESVWLEGSKSSFRRCLLKLLPSRYEEFDKRREVSESELLGGVAFDSLLKRMHEVLVAASPLQLTPDLVCHVGNQISLQNDGHYKTVVQLDAAEYCFDASKAKRAAYAWMGLSRFGPYSRDTFSKKSPRILVITPDRAVGQVGQFVKAFRDGINSLRDSRYEAGFAGNFRLHNPEFSSCQIPLLGAGRESPARIYRRTVEDHLANHNSGYDAAIIILLDEHAHLPESENPYLVTKAVLLMAGIPVQEAKLSTITKDAYASQYIFQNIAVALYAKMGGVPWTVDQALAVDDEIVIGIGTAELSGSRFATRQRHVGITTVFRGDGNYLLSHLSRECTYDEYSEVLRSTTADVLREIKVRNGWRRNDIVRLVFHAFKPFRKVEVAEIIARCVQEVGSEQRIEFAFLTVAKDHSFKIVDTSQKGLEVKNGRGRKGAFAPQRGFTAQLGGYTRLLATNGPTLIKRVTSPLPSPLLVHLHPQSTYRDQRYLTEQVLKFTALSWRSTLPAQEPVTILYSEMIAGLLSRLKAVTDWSPSALNTRLRHHMWFL